MSMLAKVAIGVCATIAMGSVASIVLLAFLWAQSVPVPDQGPPVYSLETALWPAPRDARAQSTPREVARSFVREFLGVDDPALGPYRPDLRRVLMFRRGADGRRTETVTTGIWVTKLDDKRWFVTRVEGGPVLSEPEPGPVISSPVRIVGLGVDGARRVSLRVHARFEPAPLAVASAIAGPRGQDPFSTVLTFDRPRPRRGVIVTQGGPGSDAFSVVSVRFAAR